MRNRFHRCTFFDFSSFGNKRHLERQSWNWHSKTFNIERNYLWRLQNLSIRESFPIYFNRHNKLRLHCFDSYFQSQYKTTIQLVQENESRFKMSIHLSQENQSRFKIRIHSKRKVNRNSKRRFTWIGQMNRDSFSQFVWIEFFNRDIISRFMWLGFLNTIQILASYKSKFLIANQINHLICVNRDIESRSKFFDSSFEKQSIHPFCSRLRFNSDELKSITWTALQFF